MKVYVYKKCVGCGIEKEENRASRCKKCKAECTRNYNYVRKVFTKCVSCGLEKKESTSSRCNRCLYDYRIKYKTNLELASLRKDEIREFVNKIIKRNYWFDIDDLNMIITYYSIITIRICEYDMYMPNVQIKKMFKKLQKFIEEE